MLKYNIHGVHYDISDTTREFIDNKMQRLQKYESIVETLRFTIKQKHQKNHTSYKFSANAHIRAHGDIHLEEDNDHLYAAIEILLDHLDEKLRREKEKLHSVRA